MDRPVYEIPAEPLGEGADWWAPAAHLKDEPDGQGQAPGQGQAQARPEPAGIDPDLQAALAAVVALKASDLHITVGAPPTVRIDGALRPLPGQKPWSAARVESALYSIVSAEHRHQFEAELELDFAYTSANSRFRVNFSQQRDSLCAAFRLIPQEIKQLADLGIPESVAAFSGLPRGLVLVTGPTGSGKSTTLAALVDLANRTRADHIVTVEDPIEFLHEHHMSLVNQREVGHDTHSFAAALKHVLRQDPDIILIGELRDLETISVALTAAETGHLVFATLHTQDAPQTIDRVIDVFPPHQQSQVRSQLAATLSGVVCQTLVKHASGTGRVVATEVLVSTPAIANLIREGKTHQIGSLMQAGRELGMHTLDQHLAKLVDAGQITRTAAVEKAHDLDSLEQLIKRADPSNGRGRLSAEIDFGDSAPGRGL
jgi:pilus retraction protein PilT